MTTIHDGNCSFTFLNGASKNIVARTRFQTQNCKAFYNPDNMMAIFVGVDSYIFVCSEDIMISGL